jgi:class 3 adenylate cyclase
MDISYYGMKNSKTTDYEIYNDFPIVGSTTPADSLLQTSLSSTTDEVSFSGQRENYCVCFIDMMNSTSTTYNLNYGQVSKYYSIFLNAMAIIARNFGAKIIKNAGDCLIYYFPLTCDSNDRIAFSDVLDCCSTMIDAHRFINAKLNQEGLPPLSYRISADYGMAEIARSITSASDDLFGSSMNRCAKINSKAEANGMVIGDDLYKVTNSFSSFESEYEFEEVCRFTFGETKEYPIYSVRNKQKKIILNPFKCVSARQASPNSKGCAAEHELNK